MSGDEALEIASKIFTTKLLNSFKDATPNMMYYGTISTKTIKDTVLAVYFKAPKSYTGEDLVEFQCHGGVRIVDEVLKACLDNGARIADKGEFTKRAFLNGKMTLSDAEGVIDMINAESIAAINAGYRLSKGGISDKLAAIQDRILYCVSQLEASLDYPEEMEDETKIDCDKALKEELVELRQLLNTSNIGGYIKQGIAVAIVGIANVGKSSLLNTLLGRERAIVTSVAGTTRDSIEENIEVNGILLKLIDTAGIRETEDLVESIGVERSIDAAKSSDVVIFVTEAGRELNEEEKGILDRLNKENKKIILAYNKCDKLDLSNNQKDGFAISAKKNIGIDELKQAIVDMFITKNIDASSTIITNQRHAECIKTAISELETTLEILNVEPIECVLVNLRNAYFALGEITGNCATEDIITNIFSKFCLGK